MIEVKKATSSSKEMVYEWLEESEKEKRKQYQKFSMFTKMSPKLDQEFVYKTMENSKYQNQYFYYFAYEDGKRVGLLHFLLRGSSLHVLSFYLKQEKRELYQAFLEVLETVSKEHSVKQIMMSSIFSSETELQSCLEEHQYLLEKASFTMSDLTFERKLNPFGYKISFLHERERKEVEEYLGKEELSSVTLLARKNGKLVGVLSGEIGSFHYTLAGISILVGSQKVKHELLNAFKRVCLKQNCDDIIVETNDISYEKFYIQEGFLETRKAYFRRNE